MYYVLTDRDNKDRPNPIIDVSRSRKEAESMRAAMPGGDGYAIEETEKLEDILGGEGYEWDYSSAVFFLEPAYVQQLFPKSE